MPWIPLHMFTTLKQTTKKLLDELAWTLTLKALTGRSVKAMPETNNRKQSRVNSTPFKQSHCISYYFEKDRKATSVLQYQWQVQVCNRDKPGSKEKSSYNAMWLNCIFTLFSSGRGKFYDPMGHSGRSCLTEVERQFGAAPSAHFVFLVKVLNWRN